MKIVGRNEVAETPSTIAPVIMWSVVSLPELLVHLTDETTDKQHTWPDRCKIANGKMAGHRVWY